MDLVEDGDLVFAHLDAYQFLGLAHLAEPAVLLHVLDFEAFGWVCRQQVPYHVAARLLHVVGHFVS